MGKIRFISLIILALVLTVSCATWKKSTVTTYEGIGMVLNVTGEKIVEAYKNKLITRQQYEEIRNIFNKVATTYIAAGDALAIAIGTEDVIARERHLEAYLNLIKEYHALLSDLIKLADELGIKLGG